MLHILIDMDSDCMFIIIFKWIECSLMFNQLLVVYLFTNFRIFLFFSQIELV